MNLKVKFYIK